MLHGFQFTSFPRLAGDRLCIQTPAQVNSTLPPLKTSYLTHCQSLRKRDIVEERVAVELAVDYDGEYVRASLGSKYDRIAAFDGF